MSRTNDEIIEAITPVGKLNFVYIETPEEDENGKKWYKVTIAWKKNRVEELKDLRRKAMLAAERKWGKGSVPKLQPFLRDGDNPDHNSSDIEDLHGCYYFTAKSKDKPGIVNRMGNDIDSLEVYSGCEARVSIIMGAYDNKGKKGVWIRMQNIQKAKDGERIGGKPKASKQFGKLDGFEDDEMEDGDDLL